ncbi:MAG: hypothetical protein KAU20_04020 [Nanoarchaeota archaeon]|nr:hypothetical protein [Nanoarchaeota archaeon]
MNIISHKKSKGSLPPYNGNTSLTPDEVVRISKHRILLKYIDDNKQLKESEWVSYNLAGNYMELNWKTVWKWGNLDHAWPVYHIRNKGFVPLEKVRDIGRVYKIMEVEKIIGTSKRNIYNWDKWTKKPYNKFNLNCLPSGQHYITHDMLGVLRELYKGKCKRMAGNHSDKKSHGTPKKTIKEKVKVQGTNLNEVKSKKTQSELSEYIGTLLSINYGKDKYIIENSRDGIHFLRNQTKLPTSLTDVPPIIIKILQKVKSRSRYYKREIEINEDFQVEYAIAGKTIVSSIDDFLKTGKPIFEQIKKEIYKEIHLKEAKKRYRFVIGYLYYFAQDEAFKGDHKKVSFFRKKLNLIKSSLVSLEENPIPLPVHKFNPSAKYEKDQWICHNNLIKWVMSVNRLSLDVIVLDDKKRVAYEETVQLS